MGEDNATRFEHEYALLEAMYPGEVSFNAKTSELIYRTLSASLVARIPDSYPATEVPQIISATNSKKVDVRNELKEAIKSLPEGVEAFDAILSAFQNLLSDNGQDAETVASRDLGEFEIKSRRQTIIIWLHHLLNTNKRKLALSPPVNSVSGISKPGYPGVLIFSGPESDVQEHVNILKQQNWAAFQVRYQDDLEWIFQHGGGVKEFESMSEIVNDIGDQKDKFLEAMRMR